MSPHVLRGVNSPSLERICVLLVEDHDDSREALTLALQSHGALVMAASNTKVAVALCADHLPTVVVTDINMPVRDGVWLLNHLKAHCHGVSVIAMSGMYDAVSARRVGFDAFLRKPFDPDKLCAAIAELIRPRAA
jgi:CheY-like chemotaxis protein